jgi:hypothetical protein
VEGTALITLQSAYQSCGLVLDGYLAAGDPPTLVPILVQLGRSLYEQRAIIERLNIHGDRNRRSPRRAV